MSRSNFSTMFALLAFLSLPAAQAHKEEGGGSHGGDTLVMEFTGTAVNIAEDLERLGGADGCMTGNELLRTVKTTKHTSVAEIGNQLQTRIWSDADSTKHIELSRTRITSMPADTNYVEMVIHNYMVLNQLEQVNDSARTRQCMRSVATKDLDLTSSIYRTASITSVEERFAKGEMSFQCETRNQNRDSASWRILFAPSEQESFWWKNKIFIDRRLTTGRWENSIETQELTEKRILGLFVKTYSVDTGVGEVTFNLTNSLFKNGPRHADDRLEFSSLDHLHWKVLLVFRGETFNGECGVNLMKISGKGRDDK